MTEQEAPRVIEAISIHLDQKEFKNRVVVKLSYSYSDYARLCHPEDVKARTALVEAAKEQIISIVFEGLDRPKHLEATWITGSELWIDWRW